MQIIISTCLLFVSYCTVNCGVHYIVPSQAQISNCSAASCLTLSQLAGNPSKYITSNTTLFIAGGNHTLVKALQVVNASEISLFSVNHAVSIITCLDHASLSFTNVENIYIGGVKFRGCCGNQLESVDQIFIKDSVFLGGNISCGKTFLRIIESKINISKTAFLSNTAMLAKGEEGCYQTTSGSAVGGAFVITHSTATLDACKFEGNRATVGGAIFAEFQSVITINNSEFNSNKATECNHAQPCLGGALFIGEGCTVNIHHSTFQNNTSDGDGGMAVVISTTLFMSHSFVSGNTAQLNRSAVAANQISEFTMQLGIVSHSKTLLYGGAVHFYQSNATIRNTKFSENTAEYGGTLSIEKSNLTVDNCHFTKSIATYDGGVLVARSKCTVTMTNSTFDENKTVRMHGILFVTM